MCRTEFSFFEVTVLTNTHLSIGVKSRKQKSLFALQQKNGTIVHQYFTQQKNFQSLDDDTLSDDGLNDEYDESYSSQVNVKVDGLTFEVGDTIRIELQQSEKFSRDYLCFLRNGELLWHCLVKANRGFTPIISSEGRATYIIDMTKATTSLGKSGSWEKNMRLEALDRLNPSLVAVATIAETRAGGSEILIHFDGWTDRYDYWTKTDSKDLHPIGFMAQRASFHREWNQRLQPPNRYHAAFEWNKYLIEVKNPAVPYHLFNSAQTESCKEFVFSSEAVTYFALKGISIGGQAGDCQSTKTSTGALKNSMLEELGEKLVCYEEAARSSVPLFCPLPLNVDDSLIRFPTAKAARQSTIQKYHPLCPVKGSLHFLNTEAALVSDGKSEGLTGHLGRHGMMNDLVRSVLVDMKNFLPSAVDRLFPEVKECDINQVLFCVRRIFAYALCEHHFAVEPKQGQSVLATYTDATAESVPLLETCWTNLLKEYTAPQIGIEKIENEGKFACTAHTRAIQNNQSLSTLNLSEFQLYSHLIVSLDLSYNKFKELPESFFIAFSELQEFNISHNELVTIPAGIGICNRLQKVDISYNKLTALPQTFVNCKESLMYLNISGNLFVNIPPEVFLFTNLEELEADNIELYELPEDIGNLLNLKVLTLYGNMMTKLPQSFSKLTNMIELDISGINCFGDIDSKTLVTFDSFKEVLFAHGFFRKKTEKELRELFNKHDTEERGTLDQKRIQVFNLWLFHQYPRFGRVKSAESSKNEESNNTESPVQDPDPELAEWGGLPGQIFDLVNLETLRINTLAITKLTPHFSNLINLRNIQTSHNQWLETATPEIAQLSQLESLNLKACPNLKTPPKEIVHRGFNAVFGYLKRLLMGSVECKRTKLMLVGLGGAGKTSLVRSLTGNHTNTHYYGYSPSNELTDGIDITNWTIGEGEGQGLTYSVWDFAGQVVYYNTHQFFMSNRAVYLLLWNIRLGYEHAGLDFWLSSISCHAPKAPIIVVGTHRDQVEKFWIPEEDMKRRYPQIHSFHAISTYDGTGVSEMAQDLVTITLLQKYMGEKIPEAWLKLEGALQQLKDQCLVNWKTVTSIAEELGIIDQPEIRQAIAFLHDLGSVQHFRNEYLKTRVVIDPQWIVDAMACVVSVHDTPIQDGKLLHKDLAAIWPKYEKKLLLWLLRLTEEFDLTFPIPNENLNMVPCLLPSVAPVIEWPDLADNPAHRETKMVYEFEYLPAGLFNRAQVRLYVFSDSSTIWKKGSLLKKNGHIALMQQTKDNHVLVKVQGPRPENILFMIHEVYETMIQESFHGVRYDYYVPCQDCIKALAHEPCLFPASRVRRATELKAPFLQCDKFFHTLSINELHALMPPDNNEDYDSHLERSLRELKDLRDDLTFEIFMIYSSSNIPGEGKEDQHVAPKRIYEDLVKEGFKVWFSSDPASINVESVAVTMKDAKLILVCISDEFVMDEHACNIYNFAKNTLQKMVQLVVLGESYNWQKTNMGIHMASEVFVNMMQPKRYPHKIKELVETLNGKLSALNAKKMVKYPKCFISYCWANSEDAVKKGTRGMPGSCGFGDPRKFKELLESKGISCWVDVERVGQGGLFEDIADGLRHAKLFLCCVSDEYAKSKNCQMEFRFANIALKLPMVVAVVGTGQKWEASEVGMLSLGHPKINFQHKTEGAEARMVESVMDLMPDGEEEEKEEMLGGQNNVQAFQEILELAQRKFLRQLARYCFSDETEVHYPRLLVLDFLRDEEKAFVRNRELEEKKKELQVRKEAALKEEMEREKQRREEEENRRKILEQLEGSQLNSKSKKKKRTKTKEKELPDDEIVTLESVAEGTGDVERSATTPRPPSANPRPQSSVGRPGSAIRRAASGLERFRNTLEKNMAASEKKLEEELTDYQFCIRFLCENETGWHEMPKYIPIQPPNSIADWEEILADISPYMARILAILKYCGLELEITQEKDICREFIAQLEEWCGNKSEFKAAYLSFRNLVMTWEEAGNVVESQNVLNRCQLPSGKTIWLCKGHQNMDRITVFSDTGVVNYDDMLDEEPTVDTSSTENRNIAPEQLHPENNSSPAKPPQAKPRPPSARKTSTQSAATPTAAPRRAIQKKTSTLAAEKVQPSRAQASARTAGGQAKSKACSLM